MIFYAYFFCCLSQNNYLCTLIFSLLLNMQSHPTWVRGLKHFTFNCTFMELKFPKGFGM